MKLIALSRSKFAKIEDADYESLSLYNWFLGKNGYAYRSGKMKNSVRGKAVYLHREIMGFPDGAVDHINRDKLDCRRSNLRCASKSQNALNAGVPSDNTSGHRGIDFDTSRRKWCARIKISGRQYNLGRHDDKLDAVRMRALAELRFRPFILGAVK